MSRAHNNREFIEDTGHEITKMDREVVDTDEEGNDVYAYPETGHSQIMAITSMKATDKSRSSAGQYEGGIMQIRISDAISITTHTRFQVDGITFAVEQRQPAKVGMRKLILSMVRT